MFHQISGWFFVLSKAPCNCGGGALQTENLQNILQENGGKILIENLETNCNCGQNILQENGDKILQENGDKILTENNINILAEN